MNIKDRIKSKSFWAGLIGSVFLILSAFGVDVGDQTASAVINAVCSLLVVLGIVASPVSDGGQPSGADGLPFGDIADGCDVGLIDCEHADGERDNEIDGDSDGDGKSE